MAGESSQNSQQVFKPRKQLCLKNISAVSNGKKVRLTSEPNRKVKSEIVSFPIHNKIVKKEKQNSVLKTEEECQFVKIEKPQATSSLQVKKEKIVIDLISDDESEIFKKDLRNVNEHVQELSIASKEAHHDHQQNLPAFSVPIVQNLHRSTLNELAHIRNPYPASQQEFSSGQDCLLQNDLTDFVSDEWREGWLLNNIPANEQDAQDAQDFNAIQQCEFEESGIQINTSPTTFNFHDGSTSIEAETPITIDSRDEVNILYPQKDSENVEMQASPLEKEHAIVVSNSLDDQNNPRQSNLVMEPSEEIASTINFWQMLLQFSQSNAVDANSSIQSAYTRIYISEMPVDPISEKELGKRKAVHVSSITMLPNVPYIQNTTNAPIDMNDDDEDDPYANIPHYPTEVPTKCHRCRIRDHELKMKCRMKRGATRCDLYFCKTCCLQLGDEEFQPYLEMYCCAKCDQRCDCLECKRVRRRSRKTCSKNQSTSNKKSIKTGQGIKTVTQAYRDSVRSYTARKKLPDMVVISSSSPLSAAEEVEDELRESESENGTEKPSAGSRNALADHMARYEFESRWGKTANRRHLSDGSSECIRRFNESSESEDGRATPASSVASLRISMVPGSPWHNQSHA